jgi:hypothetical protein
LKSWCKWLVFRQPSIATTSYSLARFSTVSIPFITIPYHGFGKVQPGKLTRKRQDHRVIGANCFFLTGTG